MHRVQAENERPVHHKTRREGFEYASTTQPKKSDTGVLSDRVVRISEANMIDRVLREQRQRDIARLQRRLKRLSELIAQETDTERRRQFVSEQARLKNQLHRLQRYNGE